MSYNDKKHENIEIDDMNIKSHLDDSLDLSGISVSEDLFNRTLEAIKKQTVEQPAGNEDQLTAQKDAKKDTKKDLKKVIPWSRYIRGMAGVAAAAIIVVAGYNLLNTGAYKSEDKANSMVAQEQASDTAATEESAADSTMMAMDNPDSTAKVDGDTNTETRDDGSSESTTIDTTAAETAPQFSITAGIAAMSEGEGTSGVTGDAGDTSVTYDIAADTKIAESTTETPVGSANSDTESSDPEQSITTKGLIGENVLTFRDIFLSEPEKAEYITLTDEINGTLVTLTDQVAILDFYSVMDKHQFKISTEDPDGQNYKVEINNPDVNETYVMTIGTYITVNYTDATTTSQSSYYAIDVDTLTKNLLDLIQKYDN